MEDRALGGHSSREPSSLSSPLQLLGDDGNRDDEHVSDHTRHKYDNNGESSGQAEHSTDQKHGKWQSPPNPRCSASFGDQGMTASVNAYGLLMQFGKYLGVGRSGMFSADHEFVEEPYFVIERATDLDHLSKTSSISEESYGLSLGGLKLQKDDPPELTWTHWRWPCYKYGSEYFLDADITFTIEWMIQNKVLLQRCTLENNGSHEKEIEVKFLKKMRIRELDHIDDYLTRFNKSPNDHFESGEGPGNSAWVWRAYYPSSARAEEDSKVENQLGQAKSVSVEANGQIKQPVDQREDGSSYQNEDPNLSETMAKLEYFQYEKKSTPQIRVEETTKSEEATQPMDTQENNPQKEIKEPSAVVVVAVVYINGIPKKFESTGDSLSPQIWKESVKGKEKETSNVRNRLEIVVEYRMDLIPRSKVETEYLSVPAKDIDVHPFVDEYSIFEREISAAEPDMPPQSLLDGSAGHLTAVPGGLGIPENKKATDASSSINSRLFSFDLPSGTPTNLSPSDHIKYVVRRNLEHILSVCCIPVRSRSGSKRQSDEIQPIALTCGDLSMHRVCTSASFFAFQFLVEIAKRLANDKSERINPLMERVKRACVGHIQWLLEVDKPNAGCFAANYWITGEAYPEPGTSLSWQANVYPTDTPFQIIKAAGFANIWQDKTSQKVYKRFMEQIREPWLNTLWKLDPRTRFAWPHAREEGINTFRLDDHVWIWRALKALDDWKPLQRRESGSDKKKYSLGGIQKEILQRFTTKHDVSGKRMLAVSRSARETRFLFHARDTALFYEMGLDFFSQDTSFHELWENTIQVQTDHEDNLTDFWDNAIRYALTIMMGTRDIHIDHSESAADLVRHAIVDLFQTTSPNGFFPGQLVEGTKGAPVPAHFEEEEYRDFYFHAHFEISYILLHKLDMIRKYHETSAAPEEENDQPNLSTDEKLLKLDSHVEKVDSTIEKLEIAVKQLSSSITQLSNLQLPNSMASKVESTKEDKRMMKSVMKKTFPLGSLIDSSKIVDMDEEWLYNYPDFLVELPTPLPDFKEIQSQIIIGEGQSSRGLIDQHIKWCREKQEEFGSDRSAEPNFAVFDIPKRKHVGKGKQTRYEFFLWTFDSTSEFWNKLVSKRTAEQAKKRLIWLQRPSVESSIICYLTAPDFYQASTFLFFDRHMKQKTHFSDDTSKVNNIWATEMQFSFYMMKGISKVQLAKSSEPSIYTFPKSGNMVKCASFGFRFDGDIFDRYWTCYFLQSVYLSHDDWTQMMRGFPDDVKHWRQRKVLELVFLGRMLASVVDETRLLLNNIRDEVHQGRDPFARTSGENYLETTHVQLRKTRDFLELIDERLSKIMNDLDRWDAREKDRAQQPRWTRSDERKYRESISKHKGFIERQYMDFRGLHVIVREIKKDLTTTLANNVARIQEDRNLHESENMRLFTYVTVVFLPLGFAASIFSMAGTPDVPLLVDMIVLAIVSLALTVITLMNAKNLAYKADHASRAINRASRRKIEESLMVKSQGNKHFSVNYDRRFNAGHVVEDEKSWYVWFWLAYAFIEIPAYRVIRACRILGTSNQNIQSSGSEGDSLERSPSTKREKRAVRAGTTGWEVIQTLEGLIILPFFIASWILQLICYNVLDLLKLLGGTVSKTRFVSHPMSENNDETYPVHFFKPPDWLRPILRLTRAMPNAEDATKVNDGEAATKLELEKKEESSRKALIRTQTV